MSWGPKSVVIVGLAIVCVLTGLQPGLSQQDPVKLGVITWRSGVAKSLGDDLIRGVQLAAKEANDKGGILGGRRIQLSYFDEGYSAEVVITSTKEALASDMHALLAYTDASTALAGSSYLKNADIPWVQTMSGSGRVVLSQATGLLHGNVYAEVVYSTVAKWIEDGRFRRVGHVAFDSEYSRIVQRVINKYFASSKTVQVLPTIWVPYGRAEATLELTKMLAQKPDIILADIWGSNIVVSSLRRLRELGFSGPVVIAQNSLTQPDVKAAGAAGNLAYCTFMWVKDSSVPANAAFSRVFEAMHGVEPNAISEPAYEAAKLLILAIDKAGTYRDVGKVRAAMGSLRYITPRGDPVAILPTRQLFVQSIYMVKGQAGSVVPVKRLSIPKSFYDLDRIGTP